ncbi:hypothetical protein ACQJBY_022817 [Aegilops geniculata]
MPRADTAPLALAAAQLFKRRPAAAGPHGSRAGRARPISQEQAHLYIRVCGVVKAGRMSGAQGAHPVGETTPTTYGSVGGGENRTRTDLRSREDQGNIQIEKVQDKVEDAASRKVDDSAFAARKEPGQAGDAGATGTGA